MTDKETGPLHPRAPGEFGLAMNLSLWVLWAILGYKLSAES
jgi:hypothetical protein